MFFVLYVQISPYILLLARKPVIAMVVGHNEVKITEAASNSKMLDAFINRTCIYPQKTRYAFHLC